MVSRRWAGLGTVSSMDDTGERLLKETLKGWRRARQSKEAATLQLQHVTQVGRPGRAEGDTGDTHVDAPPEEKALEDDIPELPSALLELADDEVAPPETSPPPAFDPPSTFERLAHLVESEGFDPHDDEVQDAEARDLEVQDLDDDEEEGKNLLRIKAGSFSLELEGDPDFINSVYDSVRDDLLAKLEAATQKPKEPPPKSKGGFDVDVERLKNIKVKGNGYVWVYVCHELYNKVHVVPRDTLSVSPLSSVIQTRRLSKVYVNRARLKELESLIGSGKTLWSELTTEGRRRLRRGGL